MADLKIPSLNNKSDKYIFKKKLNLRRKSKKRLFTESLFLFIFSVLLVYVNYLIPNKKLLLQNLPTTINKSFLLFIDFFSYLYEIFLVIFIFASYFIALGFYALFGVETENDDDDSDSGSGGLMQPI